MADFVYARAYTVEAEGGRISIGVCSLCGAAVVRGGNQAADVRGHDLHVEWHRRQEEGD